MLHVSVGHYHGGHFKLLVSQCSGKFVASPACEKDPNEHMGQGQPTAHPSQSEKRDAIVTLSKLACRTLQHCYKANEILTM